MSWLPCRTGRCLIVHTRAALVPSLAASAGWPTPVASSLVISTSDASEVRPPALGSSCGRGGRRWLGHFGLPSCCECPCGLRSIVEKLPFACRSSRGRNRAREDEFGEKVLCGSGRRSYLHLGKLNPGNTDLGQTRTWLSARKISSNTLTMTRNRPHIVRGNQPLAFRSGLASLESGYL